MSEIIKASTPIIIGLCATALGMTIVVTKFKASDAAWVVVGGGLGAAGGMGVASRTANSFQDTKIDNVSVDENT